MATKKTPAKSKATDKKRKTENNTVNAKTGEIVSICLIALSILGEGISGILRGLFGYTAYLLPVIMVAAIIYYLFCSDKKNIKSKLILTAVAFLNLTAIFHMIFTGGLDIELGAYYKYAQIHGSGGLIGACPGIALTNLMGAVGANIVFWSLFIILFISIFNISLVKVINGIYRMICGSVYKIKEDIATVKE